MKYIFLIIIILCATTLCYADRVCLEKTTNKLIEYQSGGSTQEDLDIMIKNAENAGYNKNDIEVKFINSDEWKIIKKEQIDKIIIEEQKQKELERKRKEEIIRLKLNLATEDFRLLREALSD